MAARRLAGIQLRDRREYLDSRGPSPLVMLPEKITVTDRSQLSRFSRCMPPIFPRVEI